MKIAFFGSSLVSAYWNGAATYYRGLLAALHARGYEATFYEPDAFERQEHCDLQDPDFARSIVYSVDGEAEVRAALRDAADCDIIVKASGVGVFDELLESAVLDLRADGRIVVFWDVDAPATLQRMETNRDDALRALIPDYDLVLTYGGGEPVIRRYEALGARHCVPIYNALDPQTHHPTPPEERFRGDLAFLGNRMPDREARVHEFFFRAADLLPGRRLLLGGNGWADPGSHRVNVEYIGHVYTRDHNAFNATPLAVLNVSRESMAANGYSPATRVFEAAGAGGCLITDAWEGIELFLEPGEECLVARSGAEVAEHVQALTPERARCIGRAALERVRREHTYEHRTAQLDALLTSAARREGMFA